ncbi:MAG: spore maturation protein [Ruminococcaceae bacterium]|nr:spore maturation protein [Oscillospiraceae bacterium]
MLNYIWVFLLGGGILFGIANGRADEVGEAIIESCGNAVEFCIGIAGITAFWCGIMDILSQTGAISFVSKLLKPIIKRLFPETVSNEKAGEYIITNISANLFGLGNGATPSGIGAVTELQKEHIRLSGDTGTGVASDSVGLFLVINSTAFQLIPSTVMAILASSGSVYASKIILPVWIVSILSLLSGVITFYISKYMRRGLKNIVRGRGGSRH